MLLRLSLFLTTPARAPIVTREVTGSLGEPDREKTDLVVVSYIIEFVWWVLPRRGKPTASSILE